MPLDTATLENPAMWPDDLLKASERFITCEFATLTKKDSPVTFPLTPFLGEDRRTIDVSTGMAYPSKAERARRNPHVAFLFSDPKGSGWEDAPVLLVYGLATVRDREVQAATDRYVRLGQQRFPAAYKGQPLFLLRRQQWYFARIWIYVTPLKVYSWVRGDTSKAPEVWEAPEGTAEAVAPSDPPPSGKQAAPWTAEPQDWRPSAKYALETMGVPVLTVVDREIGYPVPFRADRVSLEQDGFRLKMPAGMPVAPTGPACLTFHTHPEVFVGQENMAFLGEAAAGDGDSTFFTVERRLGDFSLGSTKLATSLKFLRSGMHLTPHLKRELARRNLPMPKVNVPR